MISSDWDKVAQLTTHPRSSEEIAAINEVLHLRRQALFASESLSTLETLNQYHYVNHNKKWYLPMSQTHLPTEFIPALREIALEWQQSKLDSLSSASTPASKRSVAGA